MEKIKQGTREWHEWRRGKVGASLASVIMGVSRFKTVFELWKDFGKEQKEEDKEFVHMRGHQLEEIARHWWELRTFKEFRASIAVHQDNEKVIASLDGYNYEDNAILEIKYLPGAYFDNLKDNGIIPSEYYPQLMHQALVTNCKKIIFLGIIDDRSTSVYKPEEGEYAFSFLEWEVNQKDIDYITNELVPAINKFLFYVDSRTPPPITDSDWLEVHDETILGMLKERSEIMVSEKKIKTRKDEINKRVKEYLEGCHQRILIGSYRVSIGKRGINIKELKNE